MSALPAPSSDSYELRLSPKQAQLFDVLLAQYLRDPYALIPGYVIGRQLLAGNRLAILRGKLRRVGWDIYGKMGKHGGYRLARLTKPETQEERANADGKG